MTAKPRTSRISAFLSVLCALGCSGKSLNDAGDVNTQTTGGGDSGGAHAAAGASAANAAGRTGAGSIGGNTSAGGSGNTASGGSGGSISQAGSGGSISRAGSGGSTSSGGSSGGPGTAGASATIVGTWRGYIENYKTSDLTDSVELRISQGSLAGQVIFGEAMAPPPASDPQADYPPPSDANLAGPSYVGPQAGFVYTLVNPSFVGARLQFDVAPGELYQSWCALQTPYKDDFNAGDYYNCLPNWGSIGSGGPGGTGSCSQMNPVTMVRVPRDCGQLRLCTPGGACVCTATSCTANLAAPTHFDLAIALPKADGSVVGLDGTTHNVHLTKQ